MVPAPYHPFSSAVTAMITVAAPALLWGTLAAAAPIIIHLVLRQRSRHAWFPALRLLTPKAAAGRQAQRLRYLLLLAARITILLLIVTLLMEARCQPDPVAGLASRTTGEPVSAVICVDDSASMSYRFQGRTRLEAACDLARTVIEDRGRFGPGCEFAILTGSEESHNKENSTKQVATTGLWTTDRGRAAQTLHHLSPAWHGRGAGTLLQLAYRQLAQARNPRREVYLVTDLTEHAWRGALPMPPKDLSAVCVLDAGHHENLNLTLGWPSAGEHVLPAEVSNAIACQLRTANTPGETYLELTLDGQPRGRQALGPLQANSEREVTLSIPPLPKGTHTITIELKPDDALPADNHRFACVLAGDLPRVTILADQPDNEVAAMVAAMIAPSALTSVERRYVVENIGPETLEASRLDGRVAVILADAAQTTPQGWTTLRKYLETGGTLIIIPGPNMTPAALAPATPILPAPIENIISRDPPVNVAATEFGHPYLRPFVDPGFDSVNDRPVFRHLRLGPPAAEAQVLAPFSDGSPAILTRTLGRGRVVQMAFSPAREWSLFGSQAAPMIVLLQSILADLAPRSDHVATFAAGDTARRWLDTAAGPLTLIRPGETQPRPLPPRSTQVELPTALPGHYRVLSGQDTPHAILDYSVNVPETESDMTRTTPAAISARFPPGIAIVTTNVEIVARDRTAPATIRWTVPIALALLALLIAESLFANRFYGYRQPPPSRQ
ncbi:MAG TPA: VWA domain-containing protein [Phycisphaerae bacterium]|nr:VWA domain-containing protein [Phycisphaerae bacterium]HRY71553.1 VWA domain-containing protein [Phycisphaerae bacterium]HSA29227.1 VWA domain-containing protein [Phycisphaerae bacterium]